ncbi:MAG: peptidoglycan DD-metalloendopeptidase family protein [Bacteroidetes bacterium]|jgi:murein DD-endopeptidase MepM/ murein hydrolase activator NlpD|nr:peptidoglycan DD-metalloendopeptidase family protein [Bacteroidota bacterium]
MNRFLLLVLISFSFLILLAPINGKANVRIISALDSPYFYFEVDSFTALKSDSISNNYIYSLWNEKIIDPYKINVAKKTDTTIMVLVTDSSVYVHPVKNKINSVFGFRGYRYHYGMDVDLNTGDSVLCAFDGRVRLAKYNSGYGYYVLVNHTNGLETLYGHFSKILVEEGQYVKAGDLLGYGGRTGRATGAHLHFEVRFLGKAMDPRTIIDFENYALLSDTLNMCCHTYEYLIERSKTKYHYIRSGDTLWAISRRYGVSIDRLCSLNGITRNSILKIGRPIRYQ